MKGRSNDGDGVPQRKVPQSTARRRSPMGGREAEI